MSLSRKPNSNHRCIKNVEIKKNPAIAAKAVWYKKVNMPSPQLPQPLVAFN